MELEARSEAVTASETPGGGGMTAGIIYFNTRNASIYLKAKWGLPSEVQTLSRLAVVGGGPQFRKAGNARLYEPADLDAYATAIIGPKVHSTAGLPPRKKHSTIPAGRPRCFVSKSGAR
ncbi:hypothetical protein [Methylocella sp.]|jgi:hypothetical protein|uniref:hypothetical protein n=1 Tax=Methylocella sp. TaxID=1978226 RepID=UPI003C20574B